MCIPCCCRPLHRRLLYRDSVFFAVERDANNVPCTPTYCVFHWPSCNNFCTLSRGAAAADIAIICHERGARTYETPRILRVPASIPYRVVDRVAFVRQIPTGFCEADVDRSDRNLVLCDNECFLYNTPFDLISCTGLTRAYDYGGPGLLSGVCMYMEGNISSAAFDSTCDDECMQSSDSVGTMMH